MTNYLMNCNFLYQTSDKNKIHKIENCRDINILWHEYPCFLLNKNIGFWMVWWGIENKWIGLNICSYKRMISICTDMKKTWMQIHWSFEG